MKLNRRKLSIFKFNPFFFIPIKGYRISENENTIVPYYCSTEAVIQLKVYIFWRDDWSMDRKRQMDRESNEIAMEMKFFRLTDIVLDRP